MIKALKITGIDIVELAPMIDPTGTSSVVAAKLVRECLIAIGRKIKEENHAGRQSAA